MASIVSMKAWMSEGLEVERAIAGVLDGRKRREIVARLPINGMEPSRKLWRRHSLVMWLLSESARFDFRLEDLDMPQTSAEGLRSLSGHNRKVFEEIMPLAIKGKISSAKITALIAGLPPILAVMVDKETDIEDIKQIVSLAERLDLGVTAWDPKESFRELCYPDLDLSHGDTRIAIYLAAPGWHLKPASCGVAASALGATFFYDRVYFICRTYEDEAPFMEFLARAKKRKETLQLQLITIVYHGSEVKKLSEVLRIQAIIGKKSKTS